MLLSPAGRSAQDEAKEKAAADKRWATTYSKNRVSAYASTGLTSCNEALVPGNTGSS